MATWIAALALAAQLPHLGDTRSLTGKHTQNWPNQNWHTQNWHKQRNQRSERGAAMAEYGMILLFVALAAVAMVSLFGGSVLGLFSDTHAEYRSVRPATS